jgi:hypothetical protein
MKSLIKIVIGAVVLMGGLVVVAGRTLWDAADYFRATAQTTVDGLTSSLPREVHDNRLCNDLAQFRADLVQRRVNLNRSAREIEQLRCELKTQAERAERDRRVLAEACPILEAAARGNRATVKFATADLSLADFQREIDDLLARRARDTQELAIKRDTLLRLEGRQRQAEQTLADCGRALEAAEHEVALLKSRREHAEIEGRTIALVTAISDRLKAPRESVGDSLRRLRDEVTLLESRNEAERTLASTDNRPGAPTIVREFDRMQALKALQTEIRAKRPKTARPKSSPDPDYTTQNEE